MVNIGNNNASYLLPQRVTWLSAHLSGLSLEMFFQTVL